MLRDVLCSIDNVATWPCDEINYIWRHGNVRYPSDEIPPSRATPEVKRYVQYQFNCVANKYKAHTVIEKTCANSLRVPFVNEIFPDARFVYIYRDGIDATGSARLRWTAKLDIPYLIEKVRFVPLVDLPYYGFRYFWSRIYRFFSSEKRLAFWGPKLDGMDDILKRYSLNEVCAIQWQRCVESAEAAFEDISDERIFRVSYETFVSQPAIELRRLIDFLELNVDEDQINKAVASVSNGSVGKGRSALSEDEVDKLELLVGDTLRRYGYK